MKKSDWKKMRNEFENTDITITDLAKSYGVSRASVSMHKRRNGWERKKKNVTHVTRNVTNNEALRDNVTKRKAVTDVNDSQLSEKQKLFCMLFLKYHNITKAYQEAYGCSYDSARANGSKLLARDNIKKLLSKLHDQQTNDLYLNANDILSEYAKQAFSDISDYVAFGHKTAVDENGQEYEQTYMYLKNADEVDTSLLQDISVGGSSGKKVQMYDKQKALKILLDYLPKPDNNSGKPLPLFEDIINHIQKDKNSKNDKK